jgi:hypothetical protein
MHMLCTLLDDMKLKQCVLTLGEPFWPAMMQKAMIFLDGLSYAIGYGCTISSLKPNELAKSCIILHC